MKSSRSLAAEATVFWSVVLALLVAGEIIGSFLNLRPPEPGGAFQPVIAVLFVVLAYACWRMYRLAFLITVIYAVLGVIITYVFTFEAVGNYRIVPHLLVILYSYRAYRELSVKES